MHIRRIFLAAAVSALSLIVAQGERPALADSDAIELEGSLDERQLDGTASRHWQVMIATLSPVIEAGTLSGDALQLALVRRAGAYYGVGNFQLALADCNRALSLDPKYRLALVRRAMVRMEMWLFDLARRDLDLAIARGGLNGEARTFAYVARSVARYELDDVAGGAADLRLAREEDSELLDRILEYRRMTLTVQDYRQLAQVYAE